MSRARRMAVLVDGKTYMDALVETLSLARRSIFMLGWDFHSRVRLQPDRPAGCELGAFLDALVRRRRELEVRILDWDFHFLLSFSRELAPWFRLDWSTDQRISMRLDGRHPVGACHHQKIVVVDDSVAFVGGLDLTRGRWDTPDHLADDARRADFQGRAYPPFHDVQVALDGDAARDLGRLARRRWRQATGVAEDEPVSELSHDLWPASVVPDLERVSVAIARTEPPYDSSNGVREIEELYADSIASARRSIYIENQYLTSREIGDALCASLAARSGPEIVVVSPRECSGWLEESTMGLLRHRLVRRMREADHANRFRLLYPRLPGDAVPLNVHAKLMIVDDASLHVGSANLSNRSMRFDTECDVHVDAAGDRVIERGIAGVRARLLAEHLGATCERVRETLARTRSLIRTIDVLGLGERRLAPLRVEVPEWIDGLAPEYLPADPEEPVTAFELIESWTPDLARDPQRRVAAPALAGGIALLWALRRGRGARRLAAFAVGALLGFAMVRSWAPRPAAPGGR